MSFLKTLAFDWAFWFQWVMATTLGWLIGGFIFAGLSLVASGAAIGILQLLVLQGRIRRPWRWVFASISGWIAGYLLVIFGVPRELDLINGLVLGLATGTAQWLILREELYFAGWWIVFSAIGWTTGLTLLPGFLLTGILAGAFTGLALELLWRFPKPLKVENQETT